jgi:hypothetical protein
MPADAANTALQAPPTDLSTPSSKDHFMRHCPAIHRLPRTGSSGLLRLAGTLGTLACMSIAGLGLSAAPALALAEECPNAARRAENNSTRLPECRAYETVTPRYTEGFPVQPRGYTDDGIFAYSSIGKFVGSRNGQVGEMYLATRSAAGWSSVPQTPSEVTYFITGGRLAADPRSSLFEMRPWDEEPSEESYYRRAPDGLLTRLGSYTIEGQPTFPAGESEDDSHVIVNHGNESTLYELMLGAPRPVSVDNAGVEMPAPCPNMMSGDGRVVVFSSSCSEAHSVWARVGGSATVAVSGSECTRTSGDPGGACNAAASAEFAGMATDGSRVFVTTTQQLVNGDTNQTNDLYECNIPPGTPAPIGTANPCASLTEVSGAVGGANVQRVINVSEDGSHVYFLARGVLAANLGTNDAAAVAGDNNLYVWEKDAAHPAGQTTFVAKLETNDIYSNVVQSTADGRYLIFDTANKLLPSDTDEATDVYHYDAATGALLRLSTDTNGNGGNEPGVETNIAREQSRRPHDAMTGDGSTVVFETSEALSPGDTDGVTDVYEWHAGQVSLISNGGGREAWITGSGQDIFFERGTPSPVGGTLGDISDARVGGGFPVTTPAPCSGEACQGTSALQPQAPGVSASAAFNGPGSPLAAETPPANPKPKPQTAAQRLAKALKACRSKHNRKTRKACEKRARNTYRRAK